jgi:hypothetical protein
VLILMPMSAVLGAVLSWIQSGDPWQALQQALVYALLIFLAWALAREFAPDDNPAAFISLSGGLVAALASSSPGLMTAFVTLGLVRIVNRTTGLAARRTDSIALMALSIVTIYATASPLFGGVAALAFILDGSLREPLRQQWLYGLICLGASVVYMVDHGIGPTHLSVPDSLFEWLALLFMLIFALNIILTRTVRSKADTGGRALEVNRVRAGMAIGLLAALQGIHEPAEVAVIVAAIAGICIGMAFRKGFRAPPAG